LRGPDLTAHEETAKIQVKDSPKKVVISRTADSPESDAWTRFSRFDSDRSPRMVPAAAARQAADHRDRLVALEHQGHQRTRGDELPQRRVPGLLHVLGVVPVGRLPVDDPLVQRDDGQALALEPAQHLPDQAAADGVGLDEYQGSLGHAAQAIGSRS